MSTIIGIGAPPASHLSLFNLLTSSVRPLTIQHVARATPSYDED